MAHTPFEIQAHKGGLKPALFSIFKLFRLHERRCAACGDIVGQVGAHRVLLCPRCSQELAPRTTAFCPLCGAMFKAREEPIHPCGDCLGKQDSRRLKRVVFHGPHTGRLRQLVLECKYQGRLGHMHLMQVLLARALERRLNTDLDGWKPDLLVPIPLHPARLAMRGFNQSLELARGPARLLGIPLAGNGLARTRNNPPQTGLSALERERNVHRVFSASQDHVSGKTVFLVDDVMTTGSTLEEAARTLRRAGAARVGGLVLARTTE